MKSLLCLVVAGLVGVMSADASADSVRERFTGAVCAAATPSGVGDLAYNSNGEVHNVTAAGVNRTVICSVPSYYQIDAGDSLTVNVYLNQSTNCVLRLTKSDGAIFKSISGTDDVMTLRFDAAEQGFFAANLRCSLPPGGKLHSFNVQREGV
jgi:hypothetical protein